MLTRLSLLLQSFIFWLLITSVFAQPPSTNRGGKAETTQTASGVGTTAYGVVVGISTYQFLPSLRFADRDALVFADYLVRSAGVPASQVETLINRQATLINLTDALTTVKKKVKTGDRVYVYFAGHGDIETRTDSAENAMLMLYGASRQDYNATFDKCYLREMKRWLDELTAAGAEVVFVADACRSGAFALMGGSVGQSRTMLGLGKEWAGQVKILSCEPGELAIEGVEFGNGRGLFSYCLVDGLMGMADSDKDRIVTKSELEVYLKTTVPKTARPHVQHPELLGGEGDMSIGTVNSDSLRVYQQRKTRDYSLLTATQTKGFEADLLRGLDSTTQRVYKQFEQALTARHLLHPAGQSALDYLRQLPARNNAKLRGLMTRNLVAALQVRTEGLLRPLLQEIRLYELPASIAQLDSAIAEIDTSIVLLGNNHNLIQNLTARRLFLEGKRLLTTKRNRIEFNDSLTLMAMNRFRESARLEPNMPYTYWEMSMTSFVLTQLDSSMIYMEKCLELLPNSVAVLNLIGEQYLTRNQFSKAKKYYEQALKLDASSPMSHAGLAKFYHESKDEKRTEFHRQKGIEGYERQYKGRLNEIQTAKIDIYRKIGQHDKAISIARDLLKMDSTYAFALAEIGLNYFIQQRWNESIDAYERYFRLNSSDGLSHAMIAFAYLRRYEKTKQTMDRQWADENSQVSLRLNPGNLIGLLVRYDLEFENKNYSAALLFAKQAMLINPSFASSQFRLGRVYLALNDTLQAWHCFQLADSLSTEGDDVSVELGNLYFSNRKYIAAESIYRRAVALIPDQPEVLLKLAMTLVMVGHHDDEALALCQQVQRLNPKDDAQWFLRGGILAKQNKYPEALAAFTEAIRLNPKNVQALAFMGKIQKIVGQYQPAAEAYRQAAYVDSANSTYPIEAAWLYYNKLRKNDLAFEMCSRVLAIDTAAYPIAAQRDHKVIERLAIAYAIMGHISIDRNQYDQIIHWYAKAIATKPEGSDNDNYQFQIGLAHIDLGQPAKAIPTLQEAIRLKPYNIDYHNLLATAQVRSGDAVAGETEARAVLRMDSINVRATQTLAVALLRQNRYAEAWQWGQRLEKIATVNLWEAPYFYARWFARQGNTKEALPHLEKAFKQGFGTDASVILTNPDFDPIKPDTGFMNLMRTYCPEKK
ncbi:tetratricopeptide repeat protein [Larkinella humicola]|uniref:Tetratricopeptide repeat protein n=1 Tax=Larkinella humicola TaxID=2607654 RepID=A0A5N1J793_9BACT|nr:tetratricopeptide repeat protein [Larkinella humicola]KAA9346651.1 tetratricopeptide repeat protein [Larkinella humicola]